MSPTIVTPEDAMPEIPTGEPASWEWYEQLRPQAVDSMGTGSATGSSANGGR